MDRWAGGGRGAHNEERICFVTTKEGSSGALDEGLAFFSCYRVSTNRAYWGQNVLSKQP